MHDRMNIRQNRFEHRRLTGRHFWLIALLAIVLLVSGQFVLKYLDQKQFSLIALDQEQFSLMAIDAGTGKVAWSVPLSDNKSWANFITAQADRVLVGMPMEFDEDSNRYKRFQVQAYSAASGQQLWTFNPRLSEPYRAKKMVLGASVFDSPFYAQGETLWLNLMLDTVARSANQAAPLPNIRNGKVIAIDTTTGKPRWAIDRDWSIDFPKHNGIASSGDRSVILRITPTQKVLLETYQTSTGKKLWRTQVAEFSRPLKVPSNLYRPYRLLANPDTIFLDNGFNKTIEGYDWETGSLKFQINAEGIFSEQLAMSGSTLYGHRYDYNNYESIEAFNTDTGTRRWQTGLAGAGIKCDYIKDFKAVADGIYVVCQQTENFVPQVQLFFLDAQTGHKQWFKQLSNSTYSSGIGVSIGSNSFIAWIDERLKSGRRLAAFVRGSDRELWNWQPDYSVQEPSISAGDNRVFVLGQVPRRQYLINRLNNRLS